MANRILTNGAAFCLFLHAATGSELAARGETPPAFGRRCIPAGCVAPLANIPDILSRRALSAGRLAALGATADFHHRLLGVEPRAAAATGTVTIRSDPADAAVYVDGQFAGRTPVTLERVAEGDHRVRVVKNGYVEHGRIVAVRAGRDASLQVR